jgi:TnpA family transposase
VPVEFLSDEQVEAYGAFAEVPTRPELERFFFLDDADRDLIALRRSDGHRLGMAVQIGTVRYIGRFLGDDPLAVPWEVVEYLAGQLGIEDTSSVKRYAERRRTPYEHAREIQERFQYRDFSDRTWGREFRSFLYGRAWTHAEGPVALFNHAVTWLRRHRVLLPGVSVLARQVSEARTAAERRLYQAVARAAYRVDPQLAPALRTLLVVPDGRRVSELERLRTPPVKSTGTAMVRALERVEEISAFGLGRVNLSSVPVNRLNTLARYGQLSKAQTIERAPEPRQTALLTAVVRQLEAQAVDDALDLFAVLMANRLISPARRASDRDRLAMLPQLEKAARILAKASKILTEELDLVAEAGTDLDVGALWAAVEEAVPRTAVAGAVATVEALVPEDDGSAEAAMREKLALRYNTVRPFLSLLGESDALGAALAGRRLLTAVRRLPALSRRRVKDRPLLPREVDAELVPAMWRRAVFSNPKLPQGAVDRDAYVVCVLEQLHRALNNRNVFAAPSNRWADPRARLLDGARWEAMKADVLAGLSLSEDAGEHLAQLTRVLDAAWRQMADRLAEAGDEAKVEIVVPEGGGRAKLSVDKLGAVGEPESLTWLKQTTEAMLPRIDLPDLLFEVHSWTGFLDAFKHVSDRPTRMEGLLVSLVALLVAESCNIGLTPVIDSTNTNKALTRSRLSHVDQNYLRADTIAAANAALITAQSRIELAQMWGGGLLASVDGLRFVVPVKSINTAPSPKYYGYKRGLTWLNAVNDQVAGIGAMVVRGTPRDSLFTLDTLLNLDGGVRPEMVATDNASYSDMAFGLYKMLGFRFAPRFRDLQDQRFWRAELPETEGEAPAAGYGPLEAIARNKVNLKRIATHWPDMLRVAGSLITNQVRAYDLLRMFGREGHPTPLGAAFAEYGRIDKTMHLLALVDPVDDTYRRLMNRQLTVQESRHRLARAICHGGRGQIRQAYREGQEDQLAALGLVLNAVVLWNTRYLDAAVARLRAEGHDIKDEDVARLSPLKDRHINFLGRYLFNIKASAPGQGLRPFRDPDAAEDDESD